MEKTLEAILLQLKVLSDKIDQNQADLTEFVERFEEVITTLESERRSDSMRDYYN